MPSDDDFLRTAYVGRQASGRAGRRPYIHMFELNLGMKRSLKSKLIKKRKRTKDLGSSNSEVSPLLVLLLLLFSLFLP